ncbi:hypothetical protein P7C71_g4688, partial [Lecanoromycetidae sp. Uapishka_2]
MSPPDASRFVKAVDPGNGNIVAFAKWQYPQTLSAEQAAAKGITDEKAEEDNLLPAGANRELYNAFFGAIKERRKKLMNENLDILAVSTNYQRQGLGALLLDEGLAHADKDNAKAYLEASPAGVKLYRKYGWREVDEVLTDLEMYGGSGLHSEICMMREPGGK